MQHWWKILTQHNKIIGIVLAAVLPAMGYFGIHWLESSKLESTEMITQTTSGDIAPVISGTKGDATITINYPQADK